MNSNLNNVQKKNGVTVEIIKYLCRGVKRWLKSNNVVRKFQNRVSGYWLVNLTVTSGNRLLVCFLPQKIALAACRGDTQQHIFWTNKFGAVAVRASVGTGCPQGHIVSPLQWCLVVDSLLTELNQIRFYAQGYANDITILATGKFVQTVSEVLQAALSALSPIECSSTVGSI